ncbi:hypothetical protein C7999DRAFT_43187 [Corynascus novoguineensis]|uniref:OTU domain-containing protein n=1 Tax=Corynascus novoguineensis TaxID=1126955 RepID=A0AAN7CNZ6_9PEZI|nr:hypothetical protein C7999DRAFT_43187 [Corynascus novoguineensis]
MEESLEKVQARHRKEQRDLQSRITNKKKNATKKTRKFVNEECATLERELRERQEEELRKLRGETDGQDTLEDGDDYEQSQQQQQQQQEEPSGPPIATTEVLTNKLQSTTLASPQDAPLIQPQPSQQQQQQQPRQKRNRQKERLARRAAEQEAAAAAAAAEAAAMPDRRELERRAMQKEFAAHALREHEIAPDGHCLFSAVADQLRVNGIPLTTTTTTTTGAAAGEVNMDVPSDDAGLKPRVQPYRVVRRAAAEWIASHREVYEGFLEEGVEQYVARIRDTAEWGGELELSALANAYGVEIRVVQGQGRVEVVKPGGQEEEKKKKGEGKTLWLAYYRHGYGLGEHYNSLRKAEKTET